MNPATHWQRVKGDGLIYDGPCVVKFVLFEPYAANDYTNVYDGRDTTSGTQFCQIFTSVKLIQQLDLGDGVTFGKGIYVDGVDSDVATTVGFIPLVEQ